MSGKSTQKMKKVQPDDAGMVELLRQKREQLHACAVPNYGNEEERLRQVLEIREWAEQNDQIDLVIIATLYALDSCKFLGRHQEMKRYAQEAESLIPRVTSIKTRCWSLSTLGALYAEFDEWKTGLGYLYQSLDIATTFKETEEQLPKIYHALAVAFFKAGAYDEALDYNLRLNNLLTNADAVFKRVQALINIGAVYGKLLDYQKAVECYRQALDLCGNGEYDEGALYCLLNIGSCLGEQQQFTEAIPWLEDGLKLARQAEDRWLIAEMLCELGKCHAGLDNTGPALECYDEALEIALEGRSSIQRAYVLGKRGELLLKDGNLEEARTAFLEALELSREYDQPEQDLEVHKNLAELYERMGDFQQCCEHRKKAFDIYESSVGVERQQAVGAIELHYTMLAEQQEREILRLRAEKAEQQSQIKTRELIALALKLTQRNEAFKALRKIIEPYVTEGKGGTKNFAMNVQRSFESILDMSTEWRLFEEQFQSVHQDFIETLYRTCSVLTATEIRVCILIRLNLSSKQIADTLSLSPLTIKTHRANIRRKLGLSGEGNLTSFLMSI